MLFSYEGVLDFFFFFKSPQSSLSEEGGPAGFPQSSPVGVKLEAVMEHLQRQQGAKLDMNLQEKHFQAQLLFAQRTAAAAAAARASGASLDSVLFGKADGQAYQQAQQVLKSHLSRMNPEEEDDTDDEEQDLMDSDREEEDDEDDDEEEENVNVNGFHQPTKKSRLLPPPGFPFSLYSTPQSTSVKHMAETPSPAVKQEHEEKDILSPVSAGQHAFISPNGLTDWGYDEPIKQVRVNKKV